MTNSWGELFRKLNRTLINSISNELNLENEGDTVSDTDLLACYAEFITETEFKAGQLVVWKSGLKNRNSPVEGESVVVLAVLAEPIYDDKRKAGSQHFHEPLDLMVGVMERDDDDEEDVFVIRYFDKRRFELAP